MHYFDGIIDIYDGNPLDLEKAQAIGVKAIFHQATRGLYKKDVAYQERKRRALEAGMLWGAYHLLSSEDVDAQIAYFLSMEDGSDPRVALAIDWEPSKFGMMSLDDLHRFIVRFNTILKARGRDIYPILYAGKILRLDPTIVSGDEILGKCPLWFARYTNGPLEIPRKTWSDFTLWQFDDEKRKYGAPPPDVLPGADFNSFRGTKDDLVAAWPLTRHWAADLPTLTSSLGVAAGATAASATEASAFATELAAIAIEEWIWFGSQTMDAKGKVTLAGHKEFDLTLGKGGESYAARVGRYWSEGTRTKGLDGTDRDSPWSATFISWVVRRAGAGDRFNYSIRHAVYVSQAIRDLRDRRVDAGYWAYRLDEVKPSIGDIVCWGRESGVDYDHQKSGDYDGHCDIVVSVAEDHIEIIGGNVSQSVTRRPLPLDSTGHLSPDVVSGENLFALMKVRI